MLNCFINLKNKVESASTPYKRYVLSSISDKIDSIDHHFYIWHHPINNNTEVKYGKTLFESTMRV